jgi:hypothetical protein
MKCMKASIIVTLFFVSTLFGIDQDNQNLSEKIGVVNYHRMVVRSQEHGNIMDKEIEDGIALRHPDHPIDEGFRSRKMSKSTMQLVLEIAHELISFCGKLVEVRKKESQDPDQKCSSNVPDVYGKGSAGFAYEDKEQRRK